MPPAFDYYQTLTTHGLLLILVFTGTFLVGFVYAGTSHVLGGLKPATRKLGWTGFVLMVLGTLITVSQIISGEASVLYTFYPPMAASIWFYLGLVLIILGVWASALGIYYSAAKWRKENKGQKLPLYAFFGVGIYTLLVFGTISV